RDAHLRDYRAEETSALRGARPVRLPADRGARRRRRGRVLRHRLSARLPGALAGGRHPPVSRVVRRADLGSRRDRAMMELLPQLLLVGITGAAVMAVFVVVRGVMERRRARWRRRVLGAG